MKIATVTLNPAIDQTVTLDHFQLDTVNRARSMRWDAGGKGINVASFLADYGIATAATGFLGDQNVDIFEQHFADKGIEDHFIRIAGRTRTGVKIVDAANQQTTDINLPGLTPSESETQQLFARVEELSVVCDWVVLAGNLPPDVPSSIYATMIERLKQLGKRVVLDTSRAALHDGVQAGPTMIKPNIDELQELVGRSLPDLRAVEQAARQLLDQGMELVVVSMGARGALFVDHRTALVATPPKVTIQSTVGAGDAMVAGVIAGQVQGLSLADCARLGTAFSAGTLTLVGAHLPPAGTVQSYFEQVAVRRLDDEPVPMEAL